jgi:dTDP-4-dehydrorhamnose 3,5-epimerase-like enzyme
MSRLIGERIIDQGATKLKKRVKAYLTKYKKIKADLEFTVSLDSDLMLENAHRKIESAINRTISQSKGNGEKKGLHWLDETTAEVEVTCLNNDPFIVTVDLLQDNRSLENIKVNSLSEARLSSIGVTIQFEFAFHELKGVLMDVGTFSQFLRTGFKKEFDIRKVTRSQFTVSTLENDLTLDDWIQEQRFDASLLLNDAEGERSIEFRGNKAVITSPYPEIDDQTAEYIRLTLLNYYL